MDIAWHWTRVSKIRNFSAVSSTQPSCLKRFFAKDWQDHLTAWVAHAASLPPWGIWFYGLHVASIIQVKRMACSLLIEGCIYGWGQKPI